MQNFPPHFHHQKSTVCHYSNLSSTNMLQNKVLTTGGLNLIVSSAFYETNSFTPQKTQKNKLHLQETEREFIHDMTHLQFCPRISLVIVK